MKKTVVLSSLLLALTACTAPSTQPPEADQGSIVMQFSKAAPAGMTAQDTLSDATTNIQVSISNPKIGFSISKDLAVTNGQVEPLNVTVPASDGYQVMATSYKWRPAAYAELLKEGKVVGLTVEKRKTTEANVVLVRPTVNVTLPAEVEGGVSSALQMSGYAYDPAPKAILFSKTKLTGDEVTVVGGWTSLLTTTTAGQFVFTPPEVDEDTPMYVYIYLQNHSSKPLRLFLPTPSLNEEPFTTMVKATGGGIGLKITY